MAAQNKRECKLLVTGCARSGTTYISKCLNANGVKSEHEGHSSECISSWPMAVDTDIRVWGPAPGEYRFKHILHQVRSPLKTIASVRTLTSRSWDYIMKFVPEIKQDDSITIKAAKYWYYWNLLAEAKAEFTYKVENLHDELERINRLTGFKLTIENVEKVSKNTNHRNGGSLTKEDLKKELDEELYKKIVALAARYEYADFV